MSPELCKSAKIFFEAQLCSAVPRKLTISNRNRIWAIVLMLNFGFLEEFVGANFFEQERNGMNNSKETVARCPWLSETRELCIKCSPWEDYEADVSSVSFSPAQIRILPCLKRQLAGSVALKVLNVILLKADVLLRAKVIASNWEESLLITPAEMRKNQQQQNRKMTYEEFLIETQNLNERPHL